MSARAASDPNDGSSTARATSTPPSRQSTSTHSLVVPQRSHSLTRGRSSSSFSALLTPARRYKQAKGATYAKALDEARMRGDWSSGEQSSGTGKAIPWSELTRKYAKHNPNDASTAAVAELEHQIRSALASFYAEVDYSDASHLSDSASSEQKTATLAPPTVPLKESGKGWSGDTFSTVIRELNDRRKEARDAHHKLPIAALQAYAYYAIGQDENAVELLHSVRFLEEADVQSIKEGSLSREGSEYTIVLYMMGFTVYGLANERLMANRKDEGYVPFALAGYTSAIDIHEGVRGGQRAKALRGLPADEIERWAETALYYNALFSVRFAKPAVALNALRAYQANAGRWPSTFRNPQRMVVYRTYLAELNRAIETKTYVLPPKGVAATKDDCRSIAYQTSVVAASASRVEIRDFESERALRMGAGRDAILNGTATVGPRVASRTASRRRPAPYRSVRPNDAFWRNETMTVQKAAADAMARTAEFPRAGKVNKAALDLSDELIKGWRYSGERGEFDADELADLLYTLMRFTFLSQRITRHLFTILTAAENYEEARRALKLYVQIVEKAREGDAAEAAALVSESKIREKKEEAEGVTAESKAEAEKEQGEREEEEGESDKKPERIQVSDEAKHSAQEVHIDSDSDPVYVTTLLHGAHVYCRYLNDPAAARELMDRVAKVVDGEGGKKMLNDDTLLSAKIKRVTGAVIAAHCRAINMPSKRSSMQSEALGLLQQSATMDDQSSETFFQLALLQSEMLESKLAVRSARRAVELEPANVEYWHLLALLVSAQQDLRGALRVAEEGLAEAEDDNRAGQPLSNGDTSGSRIAAAGGKNATQTMLLSMDFPPSPRERDESIIQLLITHNALEECVEGSVAAINAQREIFEYFQSRVAQWEHVPRTMTSGLAAQGRGELVNGSANAANGRADGAPRQESSYSTTIRDAGTPHRRFHSLTGMGQSGSSHHLFGFARHHHNGVPNDGDETHNSMPRAVAAPPHLRDNSDEDDSAAPTYAQTRDKRRQAEEASLLSSLWLMAAASFRRNGNFGDCRTAVQEAERVDPALPDVWLQLGLWFERQRGENPADHPIGLAIQCMYKALACETEHVGATVHLARLFVMHPLNPHIKDGAQPAVSSTLQDVASPLPQTSDNFQPTPLASELLAQTQSRRISSQPQPASEKKTKTTEALAQASSGQLTLAEERKRLATLSMAEGLLVALTQNAGWNSPEAWLYLAKVQQQTNRAERQRECLQYALELERAKPIRALSQAIRRAC